MFVSLVVEKMVLKVIAAGETLFTLVLVTFLINLHCFVICFVFL